MCIICNAGDSLECLDLANAYLSWFSSSSFYMRQVENHMLAISQKFPDEADRKRYAAFHKRLVRMRRAWNRLEQEREKDSGKTCGVAV